MKFNDLLNLRFKPKEAQQQKVSALAERSNSGELSSFSGVFRVTGLNDQEKATLNEILQTYKSAEGQEIEGDFRVLSAITAEVKAITNQAVILHGERIKKAQELLKKYRDGAFTAWLFAIYGNRQTPYNFLQYYEFYVQLPPHLHPKLDQMPRQAIYTLASRAGSLEKKQEMVARYSGQAKQELLKIIRSEFPLGEDDKRTPRYSMNALSFLKRAREIMKSPHFLPSEEEKRQITHLLAQLSALSERTR
jgi:hypothetical protein